MPISLGYEAPQSYNPIGDKATTEDGFAPSYDTSKLKNLIELYQKNPTLFTEQQIDEMQKHAVFFNVPFYKGDFNILGALSEFGKGFFGGFTTLDIGDPPDNEYESIFRSIGHLAGFAPGIAAGPLKMLRVPALAKAAAALNNRSVPMMGANWLTKQAKKVIKPVLGSATIGRSDAVKTAGKFLLGGKTKHIAEGAFHLGAASAISSWTHGIDAMMESAFGGAIAGGAFRTMGNFINTGGKQSDKIVRGLAGSLFMGLPATMRGATNSEQIYDYLLGAYFGGKEMPWYKAKAMKQLDRIERESQKNPELSVTKDPRLLKNWNELEPEVQVELEKQVKKIYGNPDERGAAAHLLMQKLGILDKDTKLPTPEGFTELKKVVGGQELVRLTTPNKVVHHGVSGGAEGSDSYWALIGEKYDVPFVHYSFKGHKTRKSAGMIRPLTEAELAEANIKIKKADESLNRLKGKKAKDFTNKLLQRNWWQVKTSNGTYAVGKIIKGGTEIEGGSGWATQMSIDAGKKHVYAWDTTSKKWHRYDYKLKKFRMLDKTPKLVKRFAAIGTRKLSKEGQKAIEDIYAVTFGKRKPKVNKKAEAVSEKEINVIPEERLKKMHELTDQADVLASELEVHLKDSTDKALSNSQRLSAKKEAEKVSVQLNEIMKELKDEAYVAAKESDIETSETQDGNDIGMISGRQLEKKSVHFIDKYAKSLWDDAGYTPVMKLTKKAHYSNMLQEIVNKSEYSGKNKRVDVEGIIEEFEAQLMDKEGLSLSVKNAGKRNLRQWLTLRNFGEQVRYLRVDDRGVSIAGVDKVYTRAGNKKLVIEPKKVLEEVYEALGGKGTDKEPAFVIFDTITSNESGAYQDLSLSRYRQLSERDNWKGPGYQQIKDGVFKRMLKKGYYPYGGKADADSIIFVKFNPVLKNAAHRKRFTQAIANNIGIKGQKQLDKDISKLIASQGFYDLKSKDKIKDMYYSNLLYDIMMNGFRPDKAFEAPSKFSTERNKQNYWNNIVKRFIKENDGFIPNATALNKRNQIWFTPGWRADPEFVKDYMESRSFSVKELDADYYGSTGKDFKSDLVKGKTLTQDNDFLYRGFSGTPIMDKNGNLILRVRTDDMFERGFPGKGKGTSVTGDSKQAREYAITRYNDRIRQAEIAEREDMDMRFAEEIYDTLDEYPATVIKINKKDFFNAAKGKEILQGADTSIKGALPEQRVVSQKDIIIPKGKWESYAMDLDVIRGGDTMMVREGEFTPKKMKQGKKGFVDDLIEDDWGSLNLKFTITKDISKELGRKLKLTDKNSDDKTSVDGMILVRDDIIDAINADAGQPESGQNKSFIVSPDSVYGALLGKYMMHSAGPDATKAMQKHGLHMIMQESAVKQKGDRNISDLKLEKNGKDIQYGYDTYDLPVRDIRYNYSVKQDAHMLDPKRIPKQMFMAMGRNTFAEFSDDIINDFFTETVYKRFEGDKSPGGYNEKLNNYINNPRKEKLNELLENIDEIGIDNLLHAIKHGHSDFTDLAYAKLMKFNREAMREMVASGEMSTEEMQEVENNLIEFNTGTDRLIKESSTMSKLEKAQGRSGEITPVFLHKYIRPFRVQVVRNYIMENLAKPKIKNSTLARMRGYDKWFQADARFKDLETRDDIFYLDLAYRDLKLETHIGGKYEKTTLGELWDAYVKNGKDWVHRADAEEVFRAATVRVPMDSTSGAQVLKFKGFTGRKGHGIMMHARAMKAEGGADLDGDEAFVFFGGRKGGKGQGFKKSWKDAFEANKEEFYDDKKEYVYDNKNEKVREELTFQDSIAETGIDPKVRDSALWKYMPSWRVTISERARDGRNQLGSASNNVQLLKTFHNSLLEKGHDTFTIEKKGFFVVKEGEKEPSMGDKYVIKPKKDSSEARKLASSMIAFSSDPLDEAGLKNHKIWFTKLYNAYFNVTKNGKKVSLTEKDFDALSYNGMYNQLRQMNQGMFSRNWSANRNFNMHEINTMTKGVNDNTTFGNEKFRNTMLPKLASIANGIDYSDSVYKRVKDVETLDNMYTQHSDLVKKYPELIKLLGRDNVTVEMNPYIENVKKFLLYNDAGVEIVAKNYNMFTKAIRGTYFAHKLTARELKDNSYKNIQERKEILRKLRDLSEDFMTNDITDMVTFKLIAKYADKIGKNKFKEIHRYMDKLKKESYLMSKNRRALMDSFHTLDKTDPKFQEFWNDMVKTHEKIYGKELTEKFFPEGKAEKPIEDISALKDQLEIDADLKSFKEKLTPEEKKVADILMLGSLRRGNLKAINELDKKWGKRLKRDPLYEDLLHHLKTKGSKTSVSKLGLNSQEVSGESIREFFGEFSKIMKTSWEKPTEFDAEVKDAGKSKEGTVYEAFVDKKVEGTEVDDIYSGFEGLDKADLSILSTEKRQVITELAENLKFYNNKMGKDLNALTRGMYKKDLNAMNLVDFADMNAYFKEVRGGTIWQKLFKEKTPDMRRRYWWQFPATVGREMMKYDITFLKSKGLFKKKGGEVVEGDIRKPTNVIEAAQNILGRMSEQGVQEGERLVGTLRQNLGFLDGLTDGEILRRIAVSEAETSEVERIFNNKEIPNELKGIQADEYRRKYSEEVKKGDYKNKKDKKYIITNTEGERETLTGKEIVDRVKGVYENHFAEMYKTIEGEKGAMDKYILGYYDLNKQEPIIDHKAFVKDVIKSFNKGEGIPLKYGLTPLRHLSRSMMIEQAKIMGNDKLLKKLMKFKINPVGRIRQGYYPHMFFSKSKALDALQRAHDYIKNLPENVMSKEEKLVQIQKLITKSKTLTGDWMTGTENWETFDKAIENIKNKESTDPISAFDNANQMTGSMNTRMAHVGGWSIDAAAAETYTRNQVNTYYKQFSQIMSRDLLNKFSKAAVKKGWHKIKDYGDKTSLLNRWQNWLKLYISESMGSPSIIPDFILNDPKMKVKGTPYAWWADGNVKDRANKIAKKLGLRGKNLLTVKHDLERVDFNDLRHWSNLEAKFELMSLLAHPKSMVNNIFGGSLHTIQSTGLEYFRKARSIKELQKINPEWESLKDVDKFVVKHGVLPEFIVAELGLSREAQAANVKGFIKDLSAKMTKTGEVDKETLRDINRKHKVSESIMAKAAKFMSVPERALRRDAFMAHYIKAWESFGGAIKNPNHPFLIEIAKKGVKATQFLYSAPYRPAFARTALGKVMTRFQLWSWNAVRFRNDVYREAKVRGFRRGTAEYERFKRTMQADLFVVALANIFAYSLFDSALPAPYNWLKDTSEWVFGDENERDRAFFGTWPTAIAPLQMITPPIARLPVSGLRAFLDNDVEKLANYHIYTMLPFGRMLRDVSPLAKGNLIENPSRLLEKILGFPLGDLQAMARTIKSGGAYKVGD